MTDKTIKERIRYRRENSVDPEDFLLTAGAIRPSDGSERLRFTSEFESQVEQNIETFRQDGVDTDVIAGIFGVDEDDVEGVDRPYTAYKILHTIENWPSTDALVFDAATDAALRSKTDQWEDVPPRQRHRMLQSLRSFQDECFFCDGTVVFGNEPVESCCSGRQVLTVHCDSCGRRFLEIKIDGENAATILGTEDD